MSIFEIIKKKSSWKKKKKILLDLMFSNKEETAVCITFKQNEKPHHILT